MGKRTYITISEDLEAAAELLRARRKYRSLSEYLAGLVRYDALIQSPHDLSEQWAAFNGWERDKLDANILADVKAGKAKRGTYLNKLIYETIKEMNGPEAKVPTIEQVTKRVAERMSDGRNIKKATK